MKNYKNKESEKESKTMCAIMFRSQREGNWVENGCAKCGKGMTKRIYDFQSVHRGKENIICSTCDKKIRKKELKNIKN